MGLADDLRAQLAVAELEEELEAAKQAGEVTRELKDKVRAARQAYRETRES